MKIFLSPAKRLNLNEKEARPNSTEPRFAKEAKTLMQTLRKKNPQELMQLMKISNDIAELNVERNHVWTAKPSLGEGFQAAYMFDGEVYRGLQEMEMSPQAQAYAQDNIYILSGLYGILRPTDVVMPYRLEMGTKLATAKAKDLYGFWGEKLTAFVNKNTQKEEVLLNLSSKEYVKSLRAKELTAKWVDVKFMDYKNGVLKQINVYFKKARGTMARYCAEHQVKTIDELKLFNGMDYVYDDNLSTEKLLVFTR